LGHGRSRFFGCDRNSWPLASNVAQAMSGERRNKAIAPYALSRGTLTLTWNLYIQ
jgi:hypothetical protein